MKDLNNFFNLESQGKGSKKPQSRGKFFGYRVLGFGAGVAAAAEYAANYLVIAGGGSGGAGGGGAGGYRASGYGPCASRSAALSIAAGTYAVVVGGGGSGAIIGRCTRGNSGSNSSLGCLVAATGGGGGGGGGSAPAPTRCGLGGGSGGGGGQGPGPASGERAGGAGNAGSYDPVEGYDGAPNSWPTGSPSYANPSAFGGGGGASEKPPKPTDNAPGTTSG